MAAPSMPTSHAQQEMQHFLDTFMYRDEAFLIDEIGTLDKDEKRIVARMDTRRPLPFAATQRVGPHHPGHVSGAEIIMVTGSLGCMHAWFFHGCRWDEGWVGFGSRIHRGDFKRLARLGPPLELESRETRARVGPNRVVLRYEFEFTQDGEIVYLGDQSAMFVRNQLPA